MKICKLPARFLPRSFLLSGSLVLDFPRDVVDLTLDSDSKDSAMPVESIAKVPGPVIRDSDRSLIPIDEGHSVGKQCCIRSLGRLKRTSPYWTTATGVRCEKGELQLLESGSRSDSASSWE